MTEGMETAISTAFNGVKTDAMSVISTALPIGLAIMGVVLAITLGVKFFKKTTK